MSKKKTSIQKFYEGKVIFLTGATGFIGKLLLEKCLRSLNLKKIYILVRVKKGKDQNTRLKKLLESPIYDKVKSLNPNFFEKISILNGDLTCPNLGLSDEDIKILINEVDCIIHCAATVSFVEHLSLATKMNVIASRDLLRIAKKMHNLHSYVHVSTAYSNMNRNEIDEIFYESAMEPDKLLEMIKTFNDDYITDLTPKIIKDFPNTYAFTKNVSETIIKREGVGLPISIIRPSIVMATHKEPLVGFVDNYLTVSGMAVAVGLGLTRTLRLDENIVFDIIPADFVANQILAMGWNNYRKSIMNIYSRFDSMRQLFDVFMTKQWYFHAKNTNQLYNSLSDDDKELFNFDVKKIDWPKFLINNATGMKIYLVKDTSGESGLKKLKRLKYIHLLLICLVITVLYYSFKLIYLVLR